MPTSVLSPGTSAAPSSDITVTTIGTISLYTELNDHFLLPDGTDFLLPDGSSLLLLPTQDGGDIAYGDFLELRIKDSLGQYQPTGKWLKSTVPVLEVGPGVWQVRRPVISSPVGVQVDLAS